MLAEKAQIEEEKTNLAAEQNRLVEEQARLSSLVDATEGEKQAAAMKAAAAQAEVARQQQVYESLQ